jgi:hypothetical protein
MRKAYCYIKFLPMVSMNEKGDLRAYFHERYNVNLSKMIYYISLDVILLH